MQMKNEISPLRKKKKIIRRNTNINKLIVEWL